MKQQTFKIGIIFVLVVGLFLAGRWTATKKIDTHHRAIDSLMRDISLRTKERDQAIDSVKHYKIMADTWFKAAESAQREKIITRTIYAQDTSRNRHFTVLQRDSVIRAEFLKD